MLVTPVGAKRQFSPNTSVNFGNNFFNKRRLLTAAVVSGGLLTGAATYSVDRYMGRLEQTVLYNADTVNIKAIPDSLKNVMQVVKTKTQDGLNLKHYYVPAEPGKKTVIFCHGVRYNATNFFDAAGFLHKNGYGAFLIEYRGFGQNKHLDKPSEKGITKDFNSVMDFLHQKGLNDKNLVLWGFSMGGGVASEGAKDYRFSGVILNSTFTGMKEVTKYNLVHKDLIKNKFVQKILRALPPQLIPIKSKFENLKKMPAIADTTLILHAKDDPTIPVEMSEELAKANKHNKLFLGEKGGHSHLGWTEREILKFLGSLK